MSKNILLTVIICLIILSSTFSTYAQETLSEDKTFQILANENSANNYNPGYIQVEEIEFLNSINLSDCETEELIVTPEYNFTAGRNNPAAYAKGNNISLNVKFKSQDASIEIIKATGAFGGFAEKQVIFENGESDWISFSSNEIIPPRIEIHNIQLQWFYYNAAQGTWEIIDETSHTIFALNKEPIEEVVWKKLAEWTTDWCEGLSDDDKELADAILNGFVEDEVVRYGTFGDCTAEILRTGDGMCAGMSCLFNDACATQGVTMPGFSYVIPRTGTDEPERLWDGIVILDPGLGNQKHEYPRPPAWKKRFLKCIDNIYPLPRFYGFFSFKDDVKIYFKNSYFFPYPDGHALNILKYENGSKEEIYLYDLSFGKGPYKNAFDTMPKAGIYNSAELKNFRKNYFDLSVDYLRGNIYFLDKRNNTRILPNIFDFVIPPYIFLERKLFHFDVKTSIIPHEINGKNQILFDIWVQDLTED